MFGHQNWKKSPQPTRREFEPALFVVHHARLFEHLRQLADALHRLGRLGTEQPLDSFHVDLGQLRRRRCALEELFELIELTEANPGYDGEGLRLRLAPEAPGAVLDESVVIAHCQSQLAGFKRPKRVLFVDALPKNPSGKLLKQFALVVDQHIDAVAVYLAADFDGDNDGERPQLLAASI